MNTIYCWASLRITLKCFEYSLKMCGRTCCTLSPDLLPFACSTVTKHNGVSHLLLFAITWYNKLDWFIDLSIYQFIFCLQKTRLPKWNNAVKYNECKESDNSVKESIIQNSKYMPGTNISPTSYTPVMLLISPYERKVISIP